MQEFIDAISKIQKIETMLVEFLELQKDGKIEKRWLNVNETVNYLGFSKSKVHKLVQEEWIEGVHYHKPTGGKILIDKNKIDYWVQYNNQDNINEIIGNTLSCLN